MLSSNHCTSCGVPDPSHAFFDNGIICFLCDHCNEARGVSGGISNALPRPYKIPKREKSYSVE